MIAAIATTAVLRRFVAVEGRRVHYRRSGSGPPIVMLHGSPGDSAVLADEMAVAAAHFTCFAPDTPGFGGSDPLAGDELQVADLARATVATMDALGLPPCPVYGTHTGALIAAEIGAGWPDRVSGLVMEGLPVFTDAEIAAIFDGYFVPMIADPLGGHLFATWTRFRDQFIWFPWTSRDVARRNPVDRPTPAEIELWVSMFYRSCRTYGPAYKAACYHGNRSYDAAAKLTVPCVYLASSEDMLFPHLDRLPPLKPEQRIARLPHDPAAKSAAIAGFLQALPLPERWTGSDEPEPVGSDPAVQYIDVAGGQVFIRALGDRGNPALVLLHDAPGTGLMLIDLARTLAADRFVIVPDLPGSGRSSTPAASLLDAGADAVIAIADGLGLAGFVVAAEGAGCAVAAVLAARGDPRLREVLVALPTGATADLMTLAPELPLAADGGHWLRAWMMIRDSQIYTPWYDGRVAAQRTTQGRFDADWLHDQTTALMESRATWHRLPREAHDFEVEASLGRATVPVRRAGADELAALLGSIDQPSGVAT